MSTDNPCPEYWEDLWAFWLCGLLAGGHSVEDLAGALRRAQSGESFRRTPQQESPLTCVERRLLRYSAVGWENRRIAQELDLNEGTVRNGLSRVFQKLGFENRTQLALYYWGLWHLLDRQPLKEKKLYRVLISLPLLHLSAISLAPIPILSCRHINRSSPFA
ncbi:helix-turn-helix domain-containing protein [Deinococcus aluminii]|uniref:HTH luxR-type domain-containing protein n=1 Tax=Deinococcus aluminii TaxID=1656885 RepID=A0ABP9XF45_9DEIO